MVEHYNITPEFDHYAYMTDLLGRAGKLEEAYSVWFPLLAACRVHKNVDLVEKVVMRICEFDSGNISVYVLLSNTYSSSGRYKDAANLRSMSSKKVDRKRPASSWITVEKKVHAFIAGDECHSCNDGIINALHGYSARKYGKR
ncbi:tetratricopeptide repeat (TPR)-like superfamily protein [Artemisia annua]|uniref:Tetratricopeptide repeat (TPR)-like superfamily protein n=1 Tax=Artemisia annua TaxID=35608 RepID=A0A2U1KYL4_ARTAN|nr:tetratricopeptide repeat (TPR)-like superfamily protein [Artemisia annua]